MTAIPSTSAQRGTLLGAMHLRAGQGVLRLMRPELARQAEALRRDHQAAITALGPILADIHWKSWDLDKQPASLRRTAGEVGQCPT